MQRTELAPLVHVGRPEDKSRAKDITLIVLGVIGIGVASVGLAALGGHQSWWGVGGLTHLGQVYAIIMIPVGGVGGILCVTIGITGRVQEHLQHLLVPIQLQSVHSTIDTSYDRVDDSGILDIVYTNYELGFGCVVDGVGHSNPRMQAALEAHFDPFIREYTEGFARVRTDTEAGRYFEAQVHVIEASFRDRTLPINQQKIHPIDKSLPPGIDSGTFLDPSYKPAMSFVQLVRVQDRLTLLTAQAGDTMVVVEMPNGELRKTQRSTNYGVGDLNDVTVQSFDITGAKRVIGFSDGIGEFVTFGELQGVIHATESSQLFTRLKETAMSPRTFAPRSEAANGAYVKHYERNNPKQTDDMSLFVLDM